MSTPPPEVNRGVTASFPEESDEVAEIMAMQFAGSANG